MGPSQFFLLNRFFGSISYMAAILTGDSEASNRKYVKKADIYKKNDDEIFYKVFFRCFYMYEIFKCV